MSCDTIETEVQIYYESSSNEKLSLTESKHLLELLVSTIKSQAAEGGFLQVGTIESVESLSAVGSENGATSNSSVCRKWGWEILRLEGMVLVSLMLLFPVTIA